MNFGAASGNLALVLLQPFLLVSDCGTSRSPKFKAADGLYLLGPLIWGGKNPVLFWGFTSGHIGFSGVGAAKTVKQLVLFEPRPCLSGVRCSAIPLFERVKNSRRVYKL